MSFCVHCGVKLADYHTECPLCGTKVINPSAKPKEIKRDYPQYREHISKHNRNQMRHYLTGTILSLVSVLYILALAIVNLMVNRTISWSLIPILSLVLVWFGVAYPFFRVKNSFYKLFSFDCFAVAVYLIVLNLIISGDVHWAKFASSAIIFLWMVLNGIVLSDRVKKCVPLLVYYIVASLAYTLFMAYVLSNNDVILSLVIPMYLAVLVIAVLAYFTAKSKAFDVASLLAIIIFNAGIVCLLVELIISKHFAGSYTLSWSLIVLLATTPLSIAAMIVKKSRDVRGFVSKKFHT